MIVEIEKGESLKGGSCGNGSGSFAHVFLFRVTNFPDFC